MSARACRRAVVAYLLLAIVAFPTQAHGYELTPDDRWAFAVAAAYWGPAPPCGEPVVTFDETAVPPESDIAASADRTRCEIYVGRFYAAAPRPERCRIIVHEVGHLHGHGHEYAGDPEAVMLYRTRADGHVWTTSPLTCRADELRASHAEAVAERASWLAFEQALRTYRADLSRWRSVREARERCMTRAWLRASRYKRVLFRRSCAVWYPKRPLPAIPVEPPVRS